MSIIQLTIKDFRNLNEVTIEPSSGVNIFYGQNGSGKTSILEAIYFLGLGKSFRTHSIQSIIRHQSEQFMLFCRVQQEEKILPIGMERFRHGDKHIRIDGENQTSLAALAKLLPLQLLTPDSHRYFHEGPKQRREFLDWGLFHVEQSFFPNWRQFQKALKQRNASLKLNLPLKEIAVWDKEIIHTSRVLDQQRNHYVSQLQPILHEFLQVFLQVPDIHLRYSRGWPKEKDLSEVLASNFSRDQQLGYTQFGPQRADLKLFAGQFPAGDYLSQGQQKLAAYALHLSQGILMQKLIKQSPIYLIDDLPSELDPEKRRFVGKVLANLQSQVFITGIIRQELQDMIFSEHRMFHVEHGAVHLSSN